MSFDFLVDSYQTERLKVLSVWAMFRDEDLGVRPLEQDPRGRSVLEQMVHQCLSEDLWFRTMLGIKVTTSPLPAQETRLGFLNRYAADSGLRQQALSEKDAGWWRQEVPFFNVPRSRAWIVVRRIAHTAHHRGQQTAMLRMLGRELYSTYGPTADTGGLPKNSAPTIYPYQDETSLLEGETEGGRKAALPGPGDKPVSERPRGPGQGRLPDR